MRFRWLVFTFLLVSLMLPNARTVAQGTEVAERIWVSADPRSADDFTFVVITVFSASDAYGLDPGVALSVTTDVIDELRESGVPESAFHYESIGDRDWTQEILVTASLSVAGQISIWGLKSIYSGDFVQRVVAVSTTLSERDMRTCLLELANQVPEEALTADDLMLDGADVSGVFGVEFFETTLDGLRILEAG